MSRPITDTLRNIQSGRLVDEATDCRTIWCSADWTAGQLQFLALIDDHAPAQAHASWRKHVAAYAPRRRSSGSAGTSRIAWP